MALYLRGKLPLVTVEGQFDRSMAQGVFGCSILKNINVVHIRCLCYWHHIDISLNKVEQWH